MRSAASVRGSVTLAVSALAVSALAVGRGLACEPDGNSAQPCPDSLRPQLLGAQYTYVLQTQTRLVSPYRGRLSLNPDGDTQSTHTMGLYLGWAPSSWAQVYLDTEKFMGAGVSGAVGLGGLTNGDVVREGAAGLPKVFYIAREYVRLMLPLGSQTAAVERAQDQIGGMEAARRLELKFGALAVSDDFDRNRYAGSTRTQFMNWSLWDDTAWDYAADTRGYTYGVVLGFVSPGWSVKYGAYLMPTQANGQKLENAPLRARGDNLELTLSPGSRGTVLRVLGYRNTARMGVYRDALAIASRTGAVPDITADDREGRHKYGFGLNLEQPLADEGNSGVFARVGWNDGRTESFAFTEVDRLASLGGQLSGARWRRAEDRAGLAFAIEGLSAPHRDYLAAGGSGFLLGDGALDYAAEQILELYYRVSLPWLANGTGAFARYPVSMQLSPDFQYVRHPGFNRDRGPVRFWGLRLHLEL